MSTPTADFFGERSIFSGSNEEFSVQALEMVELMVLCTLHFAHCFPFTPHLDFSKGAMPPC
eukprot:3778644-Prymnesium_polylepis.2